jgi:hypothetical protein
MVPPGGGTTVIRMSSGGLVNPKKPRVSATGVVRALPLSSASSVCRQDDNSGATAFPHHRRK